MSNNVSAKKVGFNPLEALEKFGKSIRSSVLEALNQFIELAQAPEKTITDSQLVFAKEETGYEAIWLTSHINITAGGSDSSSILLLDSHSTNAEIWVLYKNLAVLLDDSSEEIPDKADRPFYAIPVAENYYKDVA